MLESDGFSFAQLRESYIMAGQLAHDSQHSISEEHVREGIGEVRRQMTSVKCAGTLTKTGFENAQSVG